MQGLLLKFQCPIPKANVIQHSCGYTIKRTVKIDWFTSTTPVHFIIHVLHSKIQSISAGQRNTMAPHGLENSF